MSIPKTPFPWEILGQGLFTGLDYLVQNRQLNKQRQWAIEDRDYANRYNHPKAQIQRLKDAGLPLASFFGGGAGSQSADVRNTNIEPELGSADVLSKGAQFTIQREQAAMMKLQKDLIQAQIDKTAAEATVQQGIAAYYTSNPDTVPTTKQGVQMQAVTDQQTAKAIYEGNRAILSDVEAQFKQDMYYSGQMSAKFKAEVENFLSKNKLLDQEYDAQEIFNLLKAEQMKAEVAKTLKQLKLMDQDYNIKQELHGYNLHQQSLLIDKMIKTNSLLRQQYDINELNTYIQQIVKDGYDAQGGLGWGTAFWLNLFTKGGGGVRLPGIN